MNVSKKIILLTLIFFTAKLSHAAPAKNQNNTYDIIIAGAGTGGISAAIQAANMGASVLVIEPSTWIGGQATAAGVSTMDDMSRQKSGIYLDFINRVKKYYDSRGKSMGTCYWDARSLAFEPHVGLEALNAMINETKRKSILDVMTSANIISVKMNGKNISGVTVQSPSGKKEYSCKILIDATEYGDILPMTKTPYRIGSTTSKLIDPNAMIQDITWVVIMKRYAGGVPEHLRPKNPLPGYELAKRNYESYVTSDGFNFRFIFPVETPVNFATHNSYRGLPDSLNPYNYDASPRNRAHITKTSVNWGNDYPGAYSWNGKRGLPASYIEDKNLRRQVEHDALIKSLNFIYYVQNELGEEWSIADDEYNSPKLPDAAQNLPREWQEIARRMPVIPYVREGRRIIGKHTLTSHELLQNSLSYRDGQTSHEFNDAIAIGGYILDLHGAANDADLEWEFDERTSSIITNRPRGPFQVPMNILIPEETDGLIAAEKNLSMSRLAAGALRLQPITMMTGQAAGALAAVSVREGKRPRDVHAMLVQWELLNSGVSLSLCNYSDVPPENFLNKTVQISNMYGLIDANEYPHEPSYDIREYAFEDPVTMMKKLRGNDKGTFGIDDMITRGGAAEIISRAQKAIGTEILRAKILEGKPDDFVSRGDFVRGICEAFPNLKEIEPEKNSRLKFSLGKHRNSEYVNTLGRLGLLEIYNSDKEFRYGRPVTKGEAADIIVKTCLALLVNGV